MEGKVDIFFYQGKGGSSQKSKTNVDDEGKPKKQDPKNETREFLRGAIVGKRVLTKTSAMLMQVVDYETKKYYDLTDNVRGERDRQIIRGLIGRAQQVAVSAMNGAIIGAGTGITGSLMGAMVGATYTTIRHGIDIVQGYDKQNIEMEKQNAQLRYVRENVGASLTNGERGVNRWYLNAT